MKIKSLRLQNIKSYQDEIINFYDGVNFISGINGAGKSTIIESIGFALFDCKPGTLGEFVRYGAKSGIITVEFQANDGHLYKVVRKIGSVSSWIIYEGETGVEIDLHGAADIKPWLKECLGVEQDQELSQLFSDVVGVSQGTFTAPFLETPANRKQKFNKMLKVESYNEAHQKTREVVAAINRLIGEDEKTIARLEERVADYEAVKAQTAELAPLLAKLKQEIDSQKKKLRTFLTTRDQLRKTKAELELSTQKVQIIKVEIANLEKRVLELQEHLAKAEEAIQVLESSKPGYLAYLKNQKELAQLQEQRQERDRLAKNLAELNQELKAQTAALETAEKSLQEQLQETSQAAAAVAAQLETKQQEVHQAREQWAELDELNSLLAEFQRQINGGEQTATELGETVRRLKEGLDKWSNLKTEMTEANGKLAQEAELKQEVDGIKKLERELEQKRLQLSALQQKLLTLEENCQQTADGQCPFLNSPCQNVGGNLKEYFSQKIAETKLEMEDVQGQSERLEQAIQKGQPVVALLQNLEAERLNLNRLTKEQGKYIEAFQLLFKQTIHKDLAALAKGQLTQHLLVHEKLRAVVKTEFKEQEAELNRIASGMEKRWESYTNAVKNQGEMAMESISKLLQQLELVLEQFELFTEVAAGYGQELNSIIVAEGKTRSGHLGRLAGEQQSLEKQLQDNQAKLEQLHKQRLSLEAKAAELISLKTKQQQGEKELMSYQHLDVELAAKQEAVNQNQAAYETYMQHQEEARKAERLKAQVLSEQEQLGLKREVFAELTAKVRVLANSFKEEELEAVERNVELLQIELARGEQLAEERQKALEELQQKLVAMEKTKGEISSLAAKIQKQQRIKEIVDYVRSVFNRAGERVAGVYREYLSLEANRLYREVATENITLEWGEDYEVILADSMQARKRERSFRQLSGGEQMTAALAVRLALLGQLSGVKLGFFDEPTTNLDGERRSNLAQIIPQITGDFDQLFVISHDDSFDAMTDNVIELKKDQGEGTRKL